LRSRKNDKRKSGGRGDEPLSPGLIGGGRRPVAGCALLLVLSGCMLTPEPADLALDIPAAYRAGAARAYAAPPTLDWWGGFRSAELTGLIQEAQASNLDIAAAMARVEQADAAARASGAALLPFLSGSGNASQSRSSIAGSGVTSSPNRMRESYSAQLSASYEIDLWGKNRASLRAAEENAVAIRYAQEVVGMTVLASTANAYFQVVAAQERLALARRNLASSDRVLTLVRQRADVGTASALEIAQQESLVASVRASLPLLDQTLQQNRNVLAVLLGRAPTATSIRGGSLFGLGIPRVTPGVPADLMVQRPDIRQAEAQLAVASANVTVARAQLLPSIQLTAQGGYSSPILRTLFTPEAQFQSLAAGLVQPIFEGGRLLANLDQQQARRVELLNTYRQTILSGMSDVENALVAVQQSARREQLQRVVRDSARRAFDISETRLREGTVDQVTVLQTQQTLFSAEDGLAAARLARLQAAVSLYQALGGAWTRTPLTGEPVVRAAMPSPSNGAPRPAATP